MKQTQTYSTNCIEGVGIDYEQGIMFGAHQ
jgi:hypothetical protein